MPRTPGRAGRKARRGAKYLSEIVGDNAASFRLACGLTQAEVAQRVNALDLVDVWTQTTVSKIERGERSATVDELGVLALVFGVTLPALFDPAGPDGNGKTRLDYHHPKGTMPTRLAAQWVWGQTAIHFKPLASGQSSFRVQAAPAPWIEREGSR